MASTIVDVLMDLGLVVLASTIVWQLQMAREKKVKVTLVFGCGIT